MCSSLSKSMSAFDWIPQLSCFCCCELYGGMMFYCIFMAVLWIINVLQFIFWSSFNLYLLDGTDLSKGLFSERKCV